MQRLRPSGTLATSGERENCRRDTDILILLNQPARQTCHDSDRVAKGEAQLTGGRNHASIKNTC